MHISSSANPFISPGSLFPRLGVWDKFRVIVKCCWKSQESTTVTVGSALRSHSRLGFNVMGDYLQSRKQASDWQRLVIRPRTMPEWKALWWINQNILAIWSILTRIVASFPFHDFLAFSFCLRLNLKMSCIPHGSLWQWANEMKLCSGIIQEMQMYEKWEWLGK